MGKGFFENFDQVARWLDSFSVPPRKIPSGLSIRASRLARMRILLARFGDPQLSFKTIHVAGSKGKGSTASFIASGLGSLGFKTGLYLSPHLTDHRERFTLAGVWFAESFLTKTADLMRNGLEGFLLPEGFGARLPTTFELYTLFAFLLFREARCSWAVVETGLGGRLDATNVIVPEASVITPIELEHTDVLGRTIALIATEKSKITKTGVPVFLSRQVPQARRVFANEARSKGSEIFLLEEELESIKYFLPRYVEGQDQREDVALRFKDGFKASLSLRMVGQVQAENAALAVLVLHKLGLLTEKSKNWEEAIGATFLPGRMEKIFFKRPIFLDGAHTPRSLGSLVKTFRALFPGREGVCVFCPIRGKDIKALASIVLSAFDNIIVSKPGSFKKSDPDLVFRTLGAAVLKTSGPSGAPPGPGVLPAKGKRILLEENPEEALRTALSLCPEGAGVLVTGSFYLAGAVKEVLCRLIGKR